MAMRSAGFVLPYDTTFNFSICNLLLSYLPAPNFSSDLRGHSEWSLRTEGIDNCHPFPMGTLMAPQSHCNNHIATVRHGKDQLLGSTVARRKTSL